MKQRTMKFSHAEIVMLTRAMTRWHSDCTHEEFDEVSRLLARLRTGLGDMNYDARRAGEPVLTVD